MDRWTDRKTQCNYGNPPPTHCGMEAERCTFLDLFRSCTFRQSPIVADCCRKSPIVAARRRLSPSETEKFAQRRESSLMPCGLRALNVHVKSWPLNFHWTTILNSRETVPLDGKQCDIVLVVILCDRASMFTVCHPNLVTLIELLYTGRPQL